MAKKARAPIVDQEMLQKKMADQIAKQMALWEEDLEKQKLVLLVDGIRDDVQRTAVKEKVGQLIERKGSYSILTKGGPGGTTHLQVSPVADIAKAAGQIDFGAVVAVDIDQRTIVVDASAQPIAQPNDGWPGAKAVQKFLGQKMAAWAAKVANEGMLKILHPEKWTVVAYPGSTVKNAWADAIDAKLDSYGNRHKAELRRSYTFAGERAFRVTKLGPVENLLELARFLGDDVQCTDENLRAIILERPSRSSDPKVEIGDSSKPK